MIEGRVSAAFEAVVRLVIRGPSGQAREIDAAIDTGFNSFLTLPPDLVRELGLAYVHIGKAFLADGTEATFDVHTVFVEWGGRRRYIKAYATGKRPLVGMELLRGHRLLVDVVEGGRVVVEARG